MVTLDGQVLFDSQDLEIRALSFRRAFLERTIAGGFYGRRSACAGDE